MLCRLNKLTSAVLTLFIVILLTACGGNSHEGKIIVTVAEKQGNTTGSAGGNSQMLNSRSELLIVDPENLSGKPVSISPDFYSACSPSVSYDGKKILFSARKEQNDPWQIWEMEAGKKSIRKIISLSENCFDPVYLPGNRVVFSRQIPNDTLKADYTLFSCNIDGSDLKRLTFNPHTYYGTSILKDGRILAISRQVFPVVSSLGYMVLRPDGTKAELFYESPEGNEVRGICHETNNGKIFFIEHEKQTGKNRIVSINYNRPLHSRSLISEPDGDYLSVMPLSDSKLLVAGKTGTDGNYALYDYDLKNGKSGVKLYESAEKDVVGALLIKANEKPRNLPSEVDFGVKTGLLLCQNINLTGMHSPEKGFSPPLADRIELIGVDSSLGIIKVEDDGSVYLKIAADTPFRIRTLDSKGSTVNGPGGWYYLRPNERRGCIGCHEDREMVPANRYATAVSRNPVSVPVHVDGIVEKEVELE